MEKGKLVKRAEILLNSYLMESEALSKVPDFEAQGKPKRF